MNAITEECAIGDYYDCPQSECLNSSRAHRKELIQLIEVLNTKKAYNTETFFLAVNIADRYLCALVARGEQAPSLVLLAVTVLMIAAKANESINPCYEFTACLLPEVLQSRATKE